MTPLPKALRSLSASRQNGFRPAASLGRRRLLVQLLGGGILTLIGCRRVPQVLDDEAVFKEVDALYTAVTSRRPELLKACRDRLTNLHEEKRLSDSGFAELSSIIRTAEAGKWSESAQRLYDFIRAQRRDQAKTHGS